MRPFSQACENNKQPILHRLAPYLTLPVTLWEIGSGTGQHAVFFAEQLPHVTWQPTDLPGALPGISEWTQDCSADNLAEPVALDVTDSTWPTDEMAAVFTANTIHIMDEAAVQAMFLGVGKRLVPGGYFFSYGPFLYQGAYTSDSNAQFDLWLKSRDPRSGIKAIESLQRLGESVGLSLQDDHPMPANNQLLVWVKETAR